MPAYSPAEIHSLFQHAFNLGDVEALVALYEPNAVLVVDGQDVIGRESIRKALRNLLPGRGLMTLETRAVVVSQQGLAVLHGSWVIEPPAGMGAELATRGLSTEVVRKQQDGTWLFVIDNPYTPA
ncbi:YybH family protein [Edaphobacter aggregans]|uniref:YybH family protein n=1 Tax=Edaphobacter aggregans TaxID=570835 RepID=UPI000558791F|nr:SgcJ/EcaC family oxidoreductase [Edaphobacter aggregans]